MTTTVSEAAQLLGRLGGQAKSKRKTRTARENAKKGGRPKLKRSSPSKTIASGR